MLDGAPPTRLSPDAFARALKRLDETDPPAEPAPRVLHPDLPPPLNAYEIGPWRFVRPGFRWRRLTLPESPDANVIMLKVAAGQPVPHHGHSGTRIYPGADRFVHRLARAVSRRRLHRDGRRGQSPAGRRSGRRMHMPGGSRGEAQAQRLDRPPDSAADRHLSRDAVARGCRRAHAFRGHGAGVAGRADDRTIRAHRRHLGVRHGIGRGRGGGRLRRATPCGGPWFA